MSKSAIHNVNKNYKKNLKTLDNKEFM